MKWINDNAALLSTLFALLVLGCRYNYSTRHPPAPDASRWRWFLWRTGEFLALTRWDQVGFAGKPIAMLGQPCPELPPASQAPPVDRPPEVP